MSVEIRELNLQDQSRLLELWEKAKAEHLASRPNAQPKDLAHLIKSKTGLTLAAIDDEQLVGGAIFDPSENPPIHWLILDEKHRDLQSIQLLLDKTAVKLRAKGFHSLRIQCLGGTDPLKVWPGLRWPDRPRLDRRLVKATAQTG